MKKLFRYTEDFSYEDYSDSKKLRLMQFETVKETLCGYWIEYNSKRKFVLKGTGKRFAYESQNLALDSFIIRKQRQIIHNKRAIRIAKH